MPWRLPTLLGWGRWKREIEKISSANTSAFHGWKTMKLYLDAGTLCGLRGRGSLALHLFRCKRKDGHGLGGLFCHTHAKTGGYQ